MDIDFDIVRSDRKTVSLEITKDMRVLVRAPRRMKYDDIEVFVLKHRAWIETHLEKVSRRQASYDLSDGETLKREAERVIPERVKYYSALMGVVPSGVKITGAKTRFGSCSPKNSLCFSFYLMRYPSEAVDYVVVHELAHIKEKNHGKRFYALIEKYMPDYKARIDLLREK